MDSKVFQDYYFEQRKQDFVDLMTRTDIQRVRALTQEEALKLYNLVDENRYVNEKQFSKKLESSYICDGDRARLNRIKRTESHYAATGGSYQAAKELGAQEKHRNTVGDDRVRDEHLEDEAAGWIPFDDQYPASGELFSGENSINCRCSDMFRFKKSEDEEA